MKITISNKEYSYTTQEELLKIMRENGFNVKDDIKIGDYFQAGDRFHAGDRFWVGDGFQAGNGFKAGYEFQAGDRFRVGNGFHAGNGFKAGDYFHAGNGFKAGHGFHAGYGFQAGNNFSIEKHTVIPNGYAYISRSYFEINTQKWYIQMGCYLRTLEEWENDFWNNPKEFPNDGSPESIARLKTFELHKEIIKLQSR